MTNDQNQIKKHASSPSSLISFMEKSQDHWCIKSTDSQFIYMNAAFLDDINLSKNFNVEGKFDKEFPTAPAELWEGFVAHDQQVMRENKTISGIEIHYYGKGNTNNPVAHLSEKTPLYDDDRRIIGVVSHSRIIDTPTCLYYMNRLNRKSIQLDSPNDNFTKRELEVIFWAQQRLTAKEIAKRLEISHQTVEGHLKMIYKKIGIHSSTQLVEYCKNVGLDTYIPADFIRKGVQLIE